MGTKAEHLHKEYNAVTVLDGVSLRRVVPQSDLSASNKRISQALFLSFRPV